MKLKWLLLVFLLFGALIQTTSLADNRNDLQLLQEDTDEDEDSETHTEDDDDETDTEDEDDGKDEDDEDDEDTEDEKDEKEDAYERELEITQEEFKFEIESELKFGESKDEIEISFKVEDEAEIEFEYKIEAGSTESELKYEIEFQKIIEYVDIGVVGNGYQKGEEVSEYDIEDVAWNPILYTTEVVDVTGANINVITAETSDGVLVLVMKIAESLLDLENGVTLSPNSLKIDVEIHNFPYNTTGSSLAIKSKLKSETEFKVEDDTTEEGTGFAFDESQVSIGLGFFSWAETAVADGNVISVVSSTLEATTEEEQDEDKLETEIEQKIFFSFNASDAKDIVWDPKVGVVSQGTQELIQSIEVKYDQLKNDGDSSALPGFSFWMVLLSISTIYVIVIRMRSYKVRK
ncbi:MAG: hypothetical protein ACW99A_03370 [Candidatus Kariarchaeaceae archaeon]|jgi:hypothetical protein